MVGKLGEKSLEMVNSGSHKTEVTATMSDRDAKERDDDATYYFQGSYTRSVDEKGRFNLPYRFRRSGGAVGDEEFVLTEGPDHILCLMPHTEWLRAFQRIRRQKLTRKTREELRRQSHNSAIVVPDSQGRIKVDTETLNRHSIAERVLVMGMGHYLELWNPDRHAEHHAGLSDATPEFLDEFFG